MGKLKNEEGRQYGLWQVNKLLPERYAKNGTAKFMVRCRCCGYVKVYTGNALRFGYYAHNCERCGSRG